MENKFCSVGNLTLFLSVMMTGVHCMNAQSIVIENSIRLTSPWPPRIEVPAVRKEMSVPYLISKPDVICINTGRQLFVDSFLISQTDLVQVCHIPRYYENNPVLYPDKTWENTAEGAPYAAPFSDGVWYDESDHKFKMWYLAGAGMLYKDDSQAFYTCYAESMDGKVWQKVNQDILPGTNVVDISKRDAASVWLDRQEKDPAKRWKFFNVEQREGDKRWQVILKYSQDGIHWSKGVAQSGDVSDRTTAFYNPFTHKWVISMRYPTPLSSRSRAYLENSDPEMAVSLTHRIRSNAFDRNMFFWFAPDDKELRHEKYPDVEPGIYNFDAIAYESMILGYYSAWAGPDNKTCERDGIQKRNVVSLGYSRDGFHFSRPTHEAFMNVNETAEAWNWGNMQSVCGVPIIVGDSLYFYVSGRRLNSILWDSYSSTGLAILRRDGFVSMRSGKRDGFLITEKISFDGKYLFLNADVSQGQIYVEILDEAGRVISGYEKKNCLGLRKVNSTKQMVVWKEHSNLSDLSHLNIRLKFYLVNGDLYSFWISPWKSGESRGYTAGGGPRLNPSGIDIP